MTPSSFHRDDAASLRILLAEDSQLYEILALKTLRFYGGHHVTVAASAADASFLLDREGFDLVIIDLQMPDRCPEEIAARVRQLDAAAGRKTPIIGLSGSDLPGQQQRCDAAGMDAYITRPFVSDHLHELVLRYATQAASV